MLVLLFIWKLENDSVRLSIGLEDFNDLKDDLIQAFDRVIRVSLFFSLLFLVSSILSIIT